MAQEAFVTQQYAQVVTPNADLTMTITQAYAQVATSHDLSMTVTQQYVQVLSSVATTATARARRVLMVFE